MAELDVSTTQTGITNSIKRGYFIVIEGLDGAGTTTQAHRLVELIAKEGSAAHFTKEPSEGPIGTMLRQALSGRLTRPNGARLTPETMALLFAADRADHLASEVERLCARGITVICDRYLLSSIAYQGQELDPAFVRDINARTTNPDLTLFVRVSPEVALSRRQNRPMGEELYEALETQKRVALSYDDAARAFRLLHRIHIVDGEKTIDQVTADCWAQIRPMLNIAQS